MADLYKYICEECDIPTYVHWYATEESHNPFCANCGSDEYMKLIAEVDIYDEQELI